MITNIACQDNLSFMKSLDEKSIDLIYSDILYGTGRNFGEYKDLKPNKQDFYDFYTPRFYEMKRILKDAGNIYIQTGVQSSHWIRCILDDVFGYENFVNEIIWWYNSAPRKSKTFGQRHDTIFRYSKAKDFYFDEECEEIRVEYSPSAPRGYEKEHYYNPKGKIMDDVWRLWMLGQNDKKERNGYPTQKPEKLITPIVLSSCPKDGVFADFFLGSGTSAVIAKKLNINFIGCDISEESIKLTKERLSKI
jgi:DNA modification methylase